MPVEVLLIEVKKESEAEVKLRLAMRVSRMEHTYSMCQRLGIYPA